MSDATTIAVDCTACEGRGVILGEFGLYVCARCFGRRTTQVCAECLEPECDCLPTLRADNRGLREQVAALQAQLERCEEQHAQDLAGMECALASLEAEVAAEVKRAREVQS